MKHEFKKLELKLNGESIKGHEGLKLEIDTGCEVCKEVLKKILENVSGWRVSIILTPDYNCFGTLTHWHLNLKD